MKSSPTTLPQLRRRRRAALEPETRPRRPSSRSRHTHPTGRPLGNFPRSTGTWLARGRPAARKAKSWRATTFDRLSRLQIADCRLLGARLQTASLRKREGFAVAHRRDRLWPPPSRTDAARACTHPRADDGDVATPLARRRSPRRAGFGGAFPGRPAAICPPLSRRPPPSVASVLRLPALTRRHLPPRISHSSPSPRPTGGALRGESVQIRRVGAATVAAVAVVAAVAALATPRPPPEPPPRGARPSTYSPLSRRHRCTSQPGGREGCWGVEWRRPGRVWRACAP